MERMTLKKYASTHKMSLFNVVKMVKSGALQSETVEENGKEVPYVLADMPASTTTENRKEASPVASSEDVESRVSALEKEITILRRELDALKMSMGLKG